MNKNPISYRRIFGGIVLLLLLSMTLAGCLRLKKEHLPPVLPRAEKEVQLAPTTNIINPNSEIRGVWIASVFNINFPSKSGLQEETLKAELDAIVETTKAAGLNTIFFQVRPSADALYDSELFPQSIFLTGDTESDFDPLAYLLQKAHENNIFLHAWVNPLRVTTGSADAPQHDVSVLKDGNPAKEHPEWTVPYADGKLYFNAGIPAVRQLIAEGVAEIVRNYDVDGIVFDDYFYPYPVNEVSGKKAEFDDDATYRMYGEHFDNIGDWRRDNINQMIELCYDTVKKIDPDCSFGVSPFGIWQNDNGENGGSDTQGLSSYSALYCDTLAWVEGGYVDYIAPQLYWNFDTESAAYDILVRWWNTKLDGSGVSLLISHGAYRYTDWDNIDNEMKNQVEYARSELTYRGSVMYGYEQIFKNTHGLREELAQVFSREIYYTDPISNGYSAAVSSPPNQSLISGNNTYIIGSSDPAYPLLLEGEPVGRTKSGYFNLFVELEDGENTFTFTHKDEEYVYTLYANYNPNATSSGGGGSADKTVWLDPETVTGITPANDILYDQEEQVTFSCRAPSGSTVTVKIGGETVVLKQKDEQRKKKNDAGQYASSVFSGTYTLPKTDSGKVLNLGNVVYSVAVDGTTFEKNGVCIRVLGEGASIPVRALLAETELKTGMSSWYYDDFSVQAEGMTDNAIRQEGGMYLLRVQGYVYESAVEELGGDPVGLAMMSDAAMTVTKDMTTVRFAVSENLPHNGTVADGDFVLTLYNLDITTAKEIHFEENPLFSSVKRIEHTKENSVKYVFDLYSAKNFYGFDFSYEDGAAVLTLRNPVKLDFSSDMPLKGQTIVLDAGHGGTDVGALGMLTGGDSRMNEEDLNLLITKATAEKLTALGANVLLTRSEDATVNIYDRMAYYSEIKPNLAVSIHQNSIDYTVNAPRVRGTLGLYWADSGLLLANCVSDAVSDSLNRYQRDTSRQRLAMCRNPKFPSTLVEVGFITNAEEYELLTSSVGIDLAAEGITDGILEFYKKQAAYLEKYYNPS